MPDTNSEETMRKLIAKSSSIGLLTVLITAAGVSAAAASEDMVRAKVPFAFVAGGSQLPAGDYLVKTLGDDPAVLAITNADDSSSVVELTIAASSDLPPAEPGLVFEKLDGQYFLSRILLGDGNEREIVLTHARIEHEADAAASK
jgi:hypothetical protein